MITAAKTLLRIIMNRILTEKEQGNRHLSTTVELEWSKTSYNK